METFYIKYHEEEHITTLHDFLIANLDEGSSLSTEEVASICKLQVGEKIVFNFSTMSTCTIERVAPPASKTLLSLLSMMAENSLWAWEPKCEENKKVVILEDFDNRDDEGEGEIVKYNGWFEQLSALALERNTSWIETHHEVVSYITTALNIMDTTVVEPTVVKHTMEQQGTGGIYELAEKWTNEFELEHAGREWDGEFYDEIEAWLEKKNNEV